MSTGPCSQYSVNFLVGQISHQPLAHLKRLEYPTRVANIGESGLPREAMNSHQMIIETN